MTHVADEAAPLLLMNSKELLPFRLSNQLLPYGLKAVPEHIVATAGQYLVEKHLSDMISTMIRLQQPLDDGLRRRLAWRPALLADLIDSDCIVPEEIHRIIRTPSAALGVVALKHYLLPYFQELILSTPESAEQLFCLRKLRDDDMGLEDALFLKLVEAEPNRRQRLLSVLDPEACARDIRAVAAEAEQRRHESAAWALEWLARHLPVDDAPIEPRLAQVLARDEAYLYLAILSLRNAVLDPVVWRPLVEQVVSPRWAYQCLAAGLVVPPGQADEIARLQQVLLTDPGWLVEWLVDTAQPLGEVRRFYLQASDCAFAHELIGDLHHWYQNLTLLPAARRMAARAAG
jgi:hypothetical protein